MGTAPKKTKQAAPNPTQPTAVRRRGPHPQNEGEHEWGRGPQPQPQPMCHGGTSQAPARRLTGWCASSRWNQPGWCQGQGWLGEIRSRQRICARHGDTVRYTTHDSNRAAGIETDTRRKKEPRERCCATPSAVRRPPLHPSAVEDGSGAALGPNKPVFSNEVATTSIFSTLGGCGPWSCARIESTRALNVVSSTCHADAGQRGGWEINMTAT